MFEAPRTRQQLLGELRVSNFAAYRSTLLSRRRGRRGLGLRSRDATEAVSGKERKRQLMARRLGRSLQHTVAYCHGIVLNDPLHPNAMQATVSDYWVVHIVSIGYEVTPSIGL